MSHDLPATSHPVSHASDAQEFVAFAKAMAGARSPLRKALGLFVKLPLAVDDVGGRGDDRPGEVRP